MTKKEKNEKDIIEQAMSILGSRTSEAKAKAARENGKKGGRKPKEILATT